MRNYIKFTNVDAITKISIAQEPAANGPVFPQIKGLVYVFANESQWPTNLPIYYGTCDEDADLSVSGILGQITETEFNTAQQAEYDFKAPQQQAEFKVSVVNNVQQRLDDFAKTRNYDNIVSACTYATSSDPVFAAEGQKAVDLRTATWRKLYQILDEVKAGTRPAPTGFADIEADLPILSWE